jgi:hypothetical protein
MTHYDKEWENLINKENNKMKTNIQFTKVATINNGMQRIYKSSQPLINKANGKKYKQETEIKKVYADKEKKTTKDFFCTPEFDHVVISDAHTHTERLAFPGWTFKGVINTNVPCFYISDTIAGRNTFMTHGGDGDAVKPDAVYLRMLSKANNYQMSKEILEVQS